jgi:hypothetical protein
MTDKDKGQTTRSVLCRSIIISTCRATNVARRATMQTSVPMGTTVMRHRLDQVPARNALDGVASMIVSHYSKGEA